MSKVASPPRARGSRDTGRAREGQAVLDPGPAPLALSPSAPVRQFPPVASPIRLPRVVEGCIHCCGKCEAHPCRLKGQV